MTPTVAPTQLPSSTVPSAQPTITGAVVFIDMSKTVTASLTDEEVQEIVSDMENIFGVFPG